MCEYNVCDFYFYCRGRCPHRPAERTKNKKRDDVGIVPYRIYLYCANALLCAIRDNSVQRALSFCRTKNGTMWASSPTVVYSFCANALLCAMRDNFIQTNVAQPRRKYNDTSANAIPAPYTFRFRKPLSQRRRFPPNGWVLHP